MDSIKLKEQEILYYLGYHDQDISANLKTQIQKNMERAERDICPKVIHKTLKLDDSGFNFCADFLKDCDSVILFAATLGVQIEKNCMRLEITDMTDALIYDACASAAIEQLCDIFEAGQREIYSSQGLFLTDRFSPGYGDFPLESQKVICEYLNTSRRIGLTVSDNDLLLPRKSATAILGISKKEQKLKKRGCEVCNMFQTCAYKKHDKNCEKIIRKNIP